MLDSFSDTVAFAASMTESITFPMPSNTDFATEPTAVSVSLKKLMTELTALRNHSHLL